MTQIMDVIVIGCGASGIAALRRLHDAGLKVLGLEAGDRIGGRIHTVPFGDSTLDIGAAWCHSKTDNIVYDLAQPLGLVADPQPDNPVYLLSSGEILSPDAGDAILKVLNDAVEKADKFNDKSISAFLKELSKTEPALQKDPQLTYAFIEWYERSNHLGGQLNPKEGKSLRGLAECWTSALPLLTWKGRGYKSILDVLLNKYPDSSKQIPVEILLNKEVETVKWKASQSRDCDAKLVQIRCKDGSLYAAKSVIVTVGIQVLKDRHTKMFNPPLPKEKINVINSLQMCVLDKIYIEFSEPWWGEATAFTILWREYDKTKFSDKEKWLTNIYGFWAIEHQPNVLLAWIYGEAAKKMETIGVDEVKNGMSKLLDVVLGKQYELTPIVKVLRSQWASDRFTGGAYAYRSVATEQNGADGAVTLSEPLFQGEFPVVCFGGEASSHNRHGAVQGAIEAGFREADRLIDCLKAKN